ncbi:MAG TPA: FtsX-like permease family protein [Virgibacillus sp.]|nr:FtsX-like permease family protein [Virgibacillus sp.]
MKIILNHMVKNIFEKKLRTSIMLVTIILSTMVLFIGLSLNDILNNTYSTMVKGAYGDGNILMTKEIDNDDPFYHTEDIYTDTIDLNDRVDLINQAGMSKLDGKDVRVSIVGLDVNVAVKMKLIDPIDQDSDFELVDNRVMISARTATNYDLEVGDPFKIDMNEDTYTYTIGAISKPTGLYDSEMDDIMLVASYEPLNEVYGTENLVTSTLLQVDHDQLEDSMATLKNHHTDFSVEQVGQHESAMRDEETIQTTMFIAIVIIVMISAYVILSLSKVIIAERMPTVGTFRSLGATKGMINRLLSMEFLLYGIIGAVIGLILALLGLPIVADLFNEYKEYGLETVIHYQPTYIIIAFVFGALFPLFFGIIQIHRAHKKTLKEIMLNTTQHTLHRTIQNVRLSWGAFSL